MSYWLFAALCAFAIAVLNGLVDSMLLVVLMAMAAPLFMLALAAQFMRSVFSASAAVGLRQLVAGLAAGALIYSYYAAPY